MHSLRGCGRPGVIAKYPKFVVFLGSMSVWVAGLWFLAWVFY
jgi:hypothetical protein